MNSSATTTSTIANPPPINSVHSHISSEKMSQTSNQSPSPQLFPQMQKLSQPNQSQDVLFKIFTYTIIILPTLTSILFPIKTTMPPSEHAGNLIIDLLTVLLLSLVVKHTIEWPYNWLRQLQKTKVMLLQDMDRENTDKTILLVRKIYTFEIIALISCLVSCIFSSILLIWTRQYTIIDQKRKKVVFNNVNIALLQFWSLFRVIITFTDSLQQSSMHTNQLSWETPQLKNWYQDLSHYFLPNVSNQILLDHLQQHNRQFDQLKMDLISLQNELEEKKSLSNDSRESSFTPFPLNMSPTLLSPNASVNLSPTTSRNYVSFPFKAPPSSSESPTVASPPVPKRKSSTMKSSSSKKSSLNTIIEEDDSTLYDSKENTFTNFDEIIPGIGIATRPPTLLDEIRSMVTSVRQEVSFLDIIKHPNAVCNLLLKEFAPLLNHNFELGEYDIVRIVATEIFNNYLHNLVHDIREELGKYWNYPLYFVKKAVIFLGLRLPIYAISFYFRVSFYVPWVLFRMIVLEPIVQMGNLMLVIFKFALLTITTMTPKFTMNFPVSTSSPLPSPLSSPSSYSSSLSSSLPPSPKISEKSSKTIAKKSQKKSSHSNQKKSVIVPKVAKEASSSKFAMKPFHLSPILADSMTFENNVNNNNNQSKTRKKIHLQSIDTIPEELNTISGGKKNGRFYKYSNRLALYDD
ncbi:conserved hypothetical protein [Candida dubliniensis CD36]|uniref:Uncharacterized protein n=1 Tax=Candida dubliniensis (strain CD36 / ATCC MYA-646 / CBS 7987 / NCPF 3949 / NRRL Y-17841) TaxID=573826 RepID=B9W7W9_CANDC|nr:conserved hypothetical protein [Candida dubliniensis CD36]CAX44782.1 conserved hypothetical protein [Candida dubliniensis CD36]